MAEINLRLGHRIKKVRHYTDAWKMMNEAHRFLLSLHG